MVNNINLTTVMASGSRDLKYLDKDSNIRLFNIKDVLCVPDIDLNLFFVKKLDKEVYKICLGGDVWNISKENVT